MHELSLYGQISKADYGRVRQLLAGVTRMQPLAIEEIHLVFKARPPFGIDKIQSAGGSQGIQQQDLQRVKTMLSSGIYLVQLVGDIKVRSESSLKEEKKNGDTKMSDGEAKLLSPVGSVTWTFEFKDTPESGKQVVSSRLISRTILDDGDLMKFMDAFGYEYVSRYYVQGCKFFDQETTFRLTQMLQLPTPSDSLEASDVTKLSHPDSLRPLDGSGSYMMQTSLDIIDGNNQDLKDRGTRQLLALKDTFRQVVDLTPGDRLALDTRVAVQTRR